MLNSTVGLNGSGSYELLSSDVSSCLGSIPSVTFVASSEVTSIGRKLFSVATQIAGVITISVSVTR